jgi:glycosyltransferase involved in cell wall biosynthesis
MKTLSSLELKDFVSKPLFDEDVILSKNPLWPKISIVTPTYNQAEFLERTILSVLNQNYPNLEHIIIDGGSTDGTTKIIKKYEKYLAYWSSQKDKGMYDAINKGLKIAKGEILAYLNSDDLYYPNTIQAVVDYLQEHQKTALIYGNCDYIDSEGRYLYTYRFPAFNWKRFTALNWSSIPQPTSFWRMEIHKKIGYFDTFFKRAGDFEFYTRIGKDFRIGHIKKSLAVFRIYNKPEVYTLIGQEELREIKRRYNISDGFTIICLRWLTELHIKILNLPLMVKRLLKL